MHEADEILLVHDELDDVTVYVAYIVHEHVHENDENDTAQNDETDEGYMYYDDISMHAEMQNIYHDDVDEILSNVDETDEKYVSVELHQIHVEFTSIEVIDELDIIVIDDVDEI